MHPQSNGHVEVAIKSAKRMIYNNLFTDRSLNNDRAAPAIIQYRNTPLPDISLSPAQILLHCQLRDNLPAHPSHYPLHKEWIITAQQLEKALSKHTHLMIEKNESTSQELQPFSLNHNGTNVVIQDADKRWNRIGRVVEVLTNLQYRIRMFHSGRVTLRNRQFLRRYTPIIPGVAVPMKTDTKTEIHEREQNLPEQTLKHDKPASPSTTTDNKHNMDVAPKRIPRALKKSSSL